MKALTDKQKNVLKLIADKVKEVGYPPTLQELADELGFSSKNAALKHLAALERKGYIGKREGGAARGIRILESLGFFPMCFLIRQGMAIDSIKSLVLVLNP